MTSRATCTVWDLIASRFGPEVAERLVEPLLGSIHAGSTKKLSAAATAPQILAAARAKRSLLLGLRAMARSQRRAADGQERLLRWTSFRRPGRGDASPCRPPGRTAPRRGGATIVPSAVSALRRDGRSVVVEPAGERYDGVVLAVPAPVASALLRQLLGPTSRPSLRASASASVAVVTLGFSDSSLEVPARPERRPGGPGGRVVDDGLLVRVEQVAPLGGPGPRRHPGIGRQRRRRTLERARLTRTWSASSARSWDSARPAHALTGQPAGGG